MLKKLYSIIVYLCKDIKIVKFSWLFLDTEWISIGRLRDILSSCVLVEYLGPLQGQ
jgi:hypothetical protein